MCAQADALAAELAARRERRAASGKFNSTSPARPLSISTGAIFYLRGGGAGLVRHCWPQARGYSIAVRANLLSRPHHKKRVGETPHAIAIPDFAEARRCRADRRFAGHARDHVRRRAIQDDGQSRPADQCAERAAELADDERRLRLDALLQAHPDQPRQRQEPPHGLGAGARRHAGHRPERPRERSQSADRQRLHVHDRRLGQRLQDRRPQARQGRVRLDRRRRRAAGGQRVAHARHRAVGRSGDRQPDRRPRHRGQPRQRRDRLGQAGRQGQRVRHQGAVLHRADHRRRHGAGRQRRRRRRHPRLARGARRQDRQRAVALVRRAQARRSGQRDLEGQEQRLEDRRRRHSGRPAPTIRPPS